MSMYSKHDRRYRRMHPQPLLSTIGLLGLEGVSLLLFLARSSTSTTQRLDGLPITKLIDQIANG